MEASGGGRGGGRRREPLGLHNGAAIFSAAVHHHHHTLIDPIDRPNDDTTTSSPSSNPDPVSFAFAPTSSPGAPSMTSPHSCAAKPRPVVRYHECLRNHAASIGGSVLDGCGEFMPAGEDGTIEALHCAACDCHRNFHRKESSADPSPLAAYWRSASMSVVPVQLSAPAQAPILHYHHGNVGTTSSKPPYTSVTIVQPVSVAFGSGGSTESSSEDLNQFRTNTSTDNGHHHDNQPLGGGACFGSSCSKSSKRFRTKFSQEQKDRMMEFAERIGWRIQRQFEDEVEQFCAEVGVKRQVFKVWMHNNKNSTRSSNKQQQTPAADPDHNCQEQ